jgi:cobalt-zinc-cadmium resistance protein CzcA
MEKFLAKFIEQKVLICIIFVLCIIGGLYAFQNLPIDAFPDLTNNQVQILTDTSGMAPVETEQLVTIPIESIMNGLPKVDEIRSISKLGLSVITVVFKDDVDIYFARQLVNERMQAAKARLPEGLNPELGPITTGMGEIYQYVIEGKGYSPADLKTLHDWEIKYQLRTVPGVNEVNTWGGQTREYLVTLYPERLLQYNLTLKEVFEALKSNNSNFSGGIIEHESEQYVVRGLGLANRLEDLRNVVVKYQDGAPISIKNIAKVEYGQMLRQGAATKNGKGEVVTGIVMMLKGENSRNVIERVKHKIEEIKKSLPEGVKIKPFYDQTNLVEQTIKTVETNLVEGGVLVIAVLLIMLGNVRAALIVAATIPLAMMFSFMGMKALGLTANIMSLGAIDFGMIVDGSIVMAENTLRKLSHNTDTEISTFEIIQDSLREMARPIFFGVLIITVVYMPILSLEGMEYKMFSPMVFTVCFALLGSLLIALFLVPVLCSIFLQGKVTEKKSFIVEKIRQPYLNLLDKALSNRVKTVIIAASVFLISLLSLPFIGTEFVPKLDEGSFSIGVMNLPSISLPEAVKVTTRIENAIKNVPEVKSVVSKIGRADLATDPMGVYQTDTFVELIPKSKWRFGVTKEKLAVELDNLLQEKVPGVNFSFTQPIEMRVNELVSGVKSDIAVKIFGDDLNILSKKAGQIERVLQTVKGVADLQVEQLSGAQQVTIIPDRTKMARYGVSISDVQEIIATAIMGEPVSEILDGKKRFTLRARFPEGSNIDPALVENLLVETSDGRRIPVSQVASVTIGEGLEVVNRESGQRRIIVQCNVRGTDIGSFVREAEQKISKKVKLPPNYYIEWGGQFENQQRAMSKLSLVVPLSILIIFFLLMATFSSIKHSLLVIMNVPFAVTGGIIALWLRGMYLSVPAIVGFIALFGVAILNGLVLISTFNKLLDEGYSMKETIKIGAETRLRPVLTTAIVAILGFLPMAISTGSGAEVQKPLATVVIGGLITSTFLTLVVLPVLYSWFCHPRTKIRKKFHRVYMKINKALKEFILELSLTNPEKKQIPKGENLEPLT